MTRAHVFILHTGFAEENSLGCLTFYHPDGFDSVQEGLENLGAAFRDMTEIEFEEAKERASRPYHRCPHCDKSLFVEDPIGPDDVMERVKAALIGKTDDSGSYFNSLDDRGWMTGIQEAGQRTMLAAAVIVMSYADQIIGDVAFGGRKAKGEETFVDNPYANKWEDHIAVPDGLPLFKEITS